MPHFLDPVTNGILETPIPILISTVIFFLAAAYELIGVNFGSFWRYSTHVKKLEQLKMAKEMCFKIIKEKSCGPILLRLAWHDAASYDKTKKEMKWPAAGGAIGSIRTLRELEEPGSEGLLNAISSYLSPIKKACPLVSWADLFQMAGACSVEACGGPTIDMRYGRLDGIQSNENYAKNDNFSQPVPPYPYTEGNSNEDPVAHLKRIFNKLNMDNEDIVALLGAHTLGRAFIERSGHVKEGYRRGTKYTAAGCPFLENSETFGGRSWTKNWLRFDNSYYKERNNGDRNTVAFPIDTCLSSHPDFKPYFYKFCDDEEAFFQSYRSSHQKMSELGAKFEPSTGISI